MRHRDDGVGGQGFGQPHGDGVLGLGQGAPEGHGSVELVLLEVDRLPLLPRPGIPDHLGGVVLDGGGGELLAVQRRREDVRLEARAGLALGLRGAIEARAIEVGAPHQSDDMAVGGVDGHQGPLHLRVLIQLRRDRRPGVGRDLSQRHQYQVARSQDIGDVGRVLRLPEGGVLPRPLHVLHLQLCRLAPQIDLGGSTLVIDRCDHPPDSKVGLQDPGPGPGGDRRRALFGDRGGDPRQVPDRAPIGLPRDALDQALRHQLMKALELWVVRRDPDDGPDRKWAGGRSHGRPGVVRPHPRESWHPPRCWGASACAGVGTPGLASPRWARGPR